ncbi:MAG: RcnB family protein [Herbaspirillum sp.]
MGNKIIFPAAFAICAALAGSALAQNYDRSDQRGPQPQMQRGSPQHAGPSMQQQRRAQPAPQHAQRDERHEGRGAGPQHNFYRGQRLAPEYRNRQYVVDHWRDHHLSPPPRGQHWVQVGGDYVLVAIATGIIAQMVLGNNQ